MEWGRGFERYLAAGPTQLPVSLVERAQEMYRSLCMTQRQVRLLHGDLHHYNVLFDAKRGWLATDPKGVVGEVEYEIGASLRNPVEDPGLFASASIVARRLQVYSARLQLDLDRALQWAFSQAVLAAIWSIEDGFDESAASSFVRLAQEIERLAGWNSRGTC
jgi:streptomycin 6-kinase